MKRVHIVYARAEGARCSYHCRTYLDLKVGDTVLMLHESGNVRLATITDIKDKDNEFIKPWIVERLDIEDLKRKVSIGNEMALLDKKMMARYEEFVRNEGFEELAVRDDEMSSMLTRYRELTDEI